MTSIAGESEPAEPGGDQPTGEVAALLDVEASGGWQWGRLDGECSLAFALRRVDNALGVAEAVLLALLITVLVAIGTVQAIAGNVFNTSVGGATELLRYTVFFVAMLGAALAAQKKRLISMDVLARLLSANQRAMLDIVLALFTVAMCALLIIGGVNLYEVAKNEHYQVIPPAVGLLAFPIGIGLVGAHVALHAIIDFLHLRSGTKA